MLRARTRDRRKVAIIVSLALLLASAALAAAATAKPERAAAPAPSFELRIGNVLPFTGDLAPYGPGLDQAARMAADRINASLRRLGLSGQMSVRIVGSEDSQTQAAAAVEAAKKLVNIDRATVLIGDMASNSSIPMAQSVSIPNRVVQIAPTASAPQMYKLKDNGYVWQMLANDDLESAGSVKLAQDTFGKRAKINFGARNDAFGSAYAPLFVKRWKAGGGRIGQSFLWNPNQSSYDTEAQRLVRGDPAGWVIIDFPGTAQRFFPALARTGQWDAKRTIVNEAFKDGKFLQKIGDKVMIGLRGYAPTSNGRAGAPFAKLFESLKKKGTATSGYEGTTFDAVMLAFFAALKGGSAEGPAIKANLAAISRPPGRRYTYLQLDAAIKAVLAGRDIDYDGVWGPDDMGPGGGPSGSYDIVWKYLGKGKIVTLRKFSFGG